jgi:hypothetical protein
MKDASERISKADLRLIRDFFLESAAARYQDLLDTAKREGRVWILKQGDHVASAKIPDTQDHALAVWAYEIVADAVAAGQWDGMPPVSLGIEKMRKEMVERDGLRYLVSNPRPDSQGTIVSVERFLADLEDHGRTKTGA